MRISASLALLVCGSLCGFRDASAFGQQNQTKEEDAAFQRALKAIQSVSAAYGGPANDPKRIDFVAFGGEPAKNALHDGVLKELIGLPHLRRLQVNWSGVTDAGVKHIAKMQSLTELELESAPITDAGIRELKNLKNLVTLNLANTRITDACLKDLCAMPQLSSLNLRGTGISADGLKKLADAKTLRRLLYFPVTDRVIKNLNEIGKLSILQVATGDPAKLDSLDLSWSQVTPAGLKELKLINLKHLNLKGTPTNDAQLEQLRDLQQLRTLNLSLTHVTAAGMKHLKELKTLESLNLWKTSVDGAGLKALASLPNLRSLHMGQCPLTDADLAILPRFPRLEEVSLQKCKITDAGMKSLKECKGLKVVSLSQLDITDAGLKDLAELPELNLLLAGVTKATVDGFKVFQKSKRLKTLVIYGNTFDNYHLSRVDEVGRLLPGVRVQTSRPRR